MTYNKNIEQSISFKFKHALTVYEISGEKFCKLHNKKKITETLRGVFQQFHYSN